MMRPWLHLLGSWVSSSSAALDSSCATLTAENSFATTSNLAARGSLQVILQPAQEGQATHGAVLHNSWPLQYPDLQQLRESSHWDSVVISGIPQVPVAAASATSTTPHTNGLAVSPTSSQESLMDAQAESHSPNFEVADQAAAPDVEAQSMLILGLRGQNHDLERTLNTMQLLSHQLSPVMHSFRQQLIDQALHAANTAATAADDGDGASLGNSNADLATAQQGALAHVPSTAAAAVTALTSPTADPTPNVVASPFANSEEAVAMGQFGVVERQGRRQEISGSMPLEQMLSRLPSPIGSAAALDRASSDGATSSRHASRLGSSLDLGQLASSAQTQPPTPAPDSAADPAAAHHTQDRWSLDSFGQRTMPRRASRLGSIENSREGLAPEHSQLPAAHPQAVNFPPQEPGRTQINDAAAVVPTLSQGQAGHPFRTGYSARGLPLASGSARHSITQLISDTALPSVHHEGGSASQPSHTARPAATDPGSSLAGEPSSSGPTPQREAVDQGAVNMGGKAVTCGPAEDDMLVAQLEAEAEARIKEQQRQHPWLLYFYDREMERDYSRYHARQMAMVDVFSWGIAICVYLSLGFSSGHDYVNRIPVTFAVTLGLHLACLYATVFMQDRVRFVREQVVRTVGFVYLAVQMLGTTPSVLQSASIAQIHALPFLARYSNTSTLVTTSLAFVVRLHIHLPCQLVSFVMSAAVLPKAICKAGFLEYSSWKCIAVGVSAQFWIGVVLSTGIVAWNERRLRGMYIRSIAARSVAATKAKAS